MEVDRERSASAKVQKDLEQTRRSNAEQADQHRARIDRLGGELTQARQKLSGAEAALTEARAAGDQTRAHLDKALARSGRKVVAKKAKA